jgi:hypothetical protein
MCAIGADLPAARRGSHMHETNRVAVLIRFRPGDTRDGDHQVCRAALERPHRHGFRHRSAYRCVGGNQLPRHAERRNLVLFGVGDKTAVEFFPSARRVGQEGCQATGRTRFRRGQLYTCRRGFLQNVLASAATRSDIGPS